MKVLIVNTFDIGGAAIASKRLHLGLISNGVQSQVLLRHKTNNWYKSASFTQVNLPFYNLLQRIVKRTLKELKLYRNKNQEFLRERNKDLEMFSFPHSDCDITKNSLYEESDVINLHWVADFLDYQTFFKKNKKPVVWTLHDMNPFTGGEHYCETFLGIDEEGFPIKRSISDKEIRLANKNLAVKKLAISKISNLTVVAPSKWIEEEAKKSEIFKNVKIHYIPNSLNSEIFSPKNKNYSKDLLNLPQDKKVVLFAAESISNNRKGFLYLKRAFERIEDSNIVLCAIGSKKNSLESIKNVVELGPINDEILMAVAYSAADVFVIPSLMDNLPNTVLESLFCGTPVIGFPVGGIRDMIQDGENGFLAEEISVDSLVLTLNKFLTNANCFDRERIRQNALNKYATAIQSERYIDLFRSILKTTNS